MMLGHFKPTSGKILGVIILLTLMSFVKGILPYMSNPLMALDRGISFGFPMDFLTIQGTTINSPNIPSLLIDAVIFYIVVCILSFAFGGKKKQEQKVEQGRIEQNVPNSYSSGGNTSPSNEARS
jgi:hypothetical protein